MTWTTLGASDTIRDIYKDDGTIEVEITLATGDIYLGQSTTVIQGAQRAKLAKASGGSEVTIKAELNPATSQITAVSYELAG